MNEKEKEFIASFQALMKRYGVELRDETTVNEQYFDFYFMGKEIDLSLEKIYFMDKI